MFEQKHASIEATKKFLRETYPSEVVVNEGGMLRLVRQAIHDDTECAIYFQSDDSVTLVHWRTLEGSLDRTDCVEFEPGCLGFFDSLANEIERDIQESEWYSSE